MLNTTQTKKILIPSGTAALQLKTFTAKLRPEYADCIGVCMYTSSNGGDPNFQVELTDTNGSPIFDAVHNREVEGHSTIPLKDRYKEQFFAAAGREFIIRITTTANLTSDLVADFVFKLRNCNND